jgi:murein DD-endopeptidase MepM/ murein hydrolase activator NlpD
LRKRYYILLVARDAEGYLRKIPIPLHYLYVFLAGALIGMLSFTGIAGSYVRMLMKVAHVDRLRSEKRALEDRYSRLEQVAKEKDIQVASLGSLASEVSALYGLRAEPVLAPPPGEEVADQQFSYFVDQLIALRQSALSGAATVGIELGRHDLTTADWLRAAAAPTLWPVEGAVTGSFGERIDPFSGEGAFHSGVDISCAYGNPVAAPADGVVIFADRMSGYGRVVTLDHGQGVSTRLGHLSSFAVMAGQSVRRGDVIGYVGQSGRTTGPHLHYEVRIHNTPVNPYKYLRRSMAQSLHMAAGS